MTLVVLVGDSCLVHFTGLLIQRLRVGELVQGSTPYGLQVVKSHGLNCVVLLRMLRTDEQADDTVQMLAKGLRLVDHIAREACAWRDVHVEVFDKSKRSINLWVLDNTLASPETCRAGYHRGAIPTTGGDRKVVAHWVAKRGNDNLLVDGIKQAVTSDSHGGRGEWFGTDVERCERQKEEGVPFIRLFCWR